MPVMGISSDQIQDQWKEFTSSYKSFGMEKKRYNILIVLFVKLPLILQEQLKTLIFI